MRIISGSARGLKLDSPPGMITRPMPDRIKESIFNILGDDVIESNVLDMFAGTGSLGLEALSRDSECCYFIESCPQIQKILERNIEKARLQDYSVVIKGSAFNALQWMPEEPFHLIFFDPPYMYLDQPSMRRECLQFLEKFVLQVGAPNVCVVLHCRKGAMAGMPIPDALKIRDHREYGSAEIFFLERK